MSAPDPTPAVPSAPTPEWLESLRAAQAAVANARSALRSGMAAACDEQMALAEKHLRAMAEGRQS